MEILNQEEIIWYTISETDEWKKSNGESFNELYHS